MNPKFSVHRVSTAIRKCGTLQTHTQNTSTQAQRDTGSTNAGLRYTPPSESKTAHMRPRGSVINLRTFQSNLMLSSSWLPNVSFKRGVPKLYDTTWDFWRLGNDVPSIRCHQTLHIQRREKVRSWRMWRRTVHSKQHGVTPQSSPAYCYTIMNTTRIFMNESLVSATRYCDQAVGSTWGMGFDYRQKRMIVLVRDTSLPTLRPTHRRLQRIPDANRPGVTANNFPLI